MKRAMVITASDGVSAGVREDASGVEVGERLEALGYTVERSVLPDEQEMLTDVPRGAMESLVAIEGVLDHAVETLAGPHDHDEGQDPTA